MKKKEECKIIQDLLPNYIENLTSRETNEYIENHLEECGECLKILKGMGEEITLDKIDEKKKIDYLKKIKHRNKLIIGIILAIAILLIIILIKFFTSVGGVAIDENGNPEYYQAFKEWITGENKLTTSKVTNILVKSKGNELETTMIMTFDKNNVCIGARYCIEGYTREEVLKKYNDLKDVGNQEIPVITNVMMNEDKIIYNYNYWNGKNKEEVLNELRESSIEYIIQEI